MLISQKQSLGVGWPLDGTHTSQQEIMRVAFPASPSTSSPLRAQVGGSVRVELGWVGPLFIPDAFEASRRHFRVSHRMRDRGVS